MSTSDPSGPSNGDLDAAFEDIVARWDEPPAEPMRPRQRPQPSPALDPLPPGAVRAPSGAVIPAAPPVGSPQQHFDARGYTPPDLPQEDFVPAAPAPLPDPQADPLFWTIVGCLTLGPLVLLVLLFTGRLSMTLLVVAAASATVVGFVLLALRGGRTAREPGDDGARV